MPTGGRLERDAERRAVAASGLMALTGHPDGPPLAPPSALVRGLDAVVADIALWSAEVGHRVDADWADILTTRARILGLHRGGTTSANGTCRLMRAVDGWIAVNLARPEDRQALPAVIERPCGRDPWETLAKFAADTPADHVVERARLVGVPAARLGRPGSAKAGPPLTSTPTWPSSGPRAVSELRVVDLSSMWAGPLATSLLARAGARVVKVESASRPDGARAHPAFYRTLHPEGQEVQMLDLDSASGRARLRMHVEEADVVVESSRPRALEQLGAAPATVAGPPGKVWLSITGYGRRAPGCDWVAFGDDAAVAGGLVSWEEPGRPVFCGDAIADPVTGLSAAAALLHAVAQGGGALLDVSMARCAASLAGDELPGRDPGPAPQPARWTTRPATTVAATPSG